VFVSVYYVKDQIMTGFHVGWDSSFDVLNVQHVGQPRNYDLIPDRSKRFFSAESIDVLRSQPVSYSLGTRASFIEVQWLGRQAIPPLPCLALWHVQGLDIVGVHIYVSVE
jgi:hypothetical protein